MTGKVRCNVDGCENTILPSTAEETGGPCMACVNKRKAEERRAYIDANRVDVDRFAGVTDPVEILKIMEDRPPFDPLVHHVPYKSARWQVYEALTRSEAEAMASHGLAQLEIDKDSADSIAAALASFTDCDLTALQMAYLDRCSDWPPEVFLGAVAVVRDRVIEVLETSRAPRNLSLLTLAWIGDEVVIDLFQGWRTNPPEWTSELFIPPYAYAKCGGWELRQDGSRRDLFVTPCYSLVPTSESPSSSVAAVVDQQTSCPWCDQKLVSMITVDLRDPLLAQWPNGLPQVTITTCHVCACYGHVFCDISTDGSSVWSAHNVRPEYLPDDSAGWGRMSTNCLVMERVPRFPHFAADWMSGAPISQVGGLPSWIQDQEYPQCPKCGDTMRFLAQISNEEIEDRAEGIYYMFLCWTCRVGATSYQQT